MDILKHISIIIISFFLYIGCNKEYSEVHVSYIAISQEGYKQEKPFTESNISIKPLKKQILKY